MLEDADRADRRAALVRKFQQVAGNGRGVNLAAMAALAVAGGLAEAADRPILTVVLHVTDLAGTRTEDFAQARAEAQRIFGDVGVRLAWVDIAQGRRSCEGLNLFVQFLSPFLIGQRTSPGGRDNVLGAASPSAGQAFIYSERIYALAPRQQVSRGVLLGRVIAHEVGHMLLAEHPHSPVGLMAASLDGDPRGGRARFTSDEARAIRAGLESRAKISQERECGTETVARER